MTSLRSAVRVATVGATVGATVVAAVGATVVGMIGTYEYFVVGRGSLQLVGPALLVGGLLILAILPQSTAAIPGTPRNSVAGAKRVMIAGLVLMLIPTLGLALGSWAAPNSELLGVLLTGTGIYVGLPGLFLAIGGAVALATRHLRSR